MNEYFKNLLLINSNYDVSSKNNEKSIVSSIPKKKEKEASYLDALDSQGRAQINLSFKGLDKSMSDEKFEALKNEFAEKIKTLPKKSIDFTKDWELSKENIQLALKLISNKNLYTNDDIMSYSNYYMNYMDEEEACIKNELFDELNQKGLINNKKFMRNCSSFISLTENKFQKNFVDFIINNENLLNNKTVTNSAVSSLMYIESNEQEKIAKKIISEEKLTSNNDFMSNFANIVLNTKTKNKYILKKNAIDLLLANDKLIQNSTFMKYSGQLITHTNNIHQAELFEKLQNYPEFIKNDDFLKKITSTFEFISNNENLNVKINLMDKISQNEDFKKNENYINYAGNLIKGVQTAYQLNVADKILAEPKLYKNSIFMSKSEYLICNCKNEHQMSVIDRIISDEDLYANENFMRNVYHIIKSAKNEQSANIINKMLDNSELCNNINSNYIRYILFLLEKNESENQSEILNKIFIDKKIYGNEKLIKGICTLFHDADNSETNVIINKFLDDKELHENEVFVQNADVIINAVDSIESAEKSIQILKDKEIPDFQKLLIIDNSVEYDEIIKLNKTIGKNEASKLSNAETKLAVKFTDLYNKIDINEIPISAKRELLHSLVSLNENILIISENIKKMFPLLPDNEDDYAKLLPNIVKSLGINTNVLLDKHFDNKLNHLGKTLQDISDEEFKNIKITQEYTKDEFIHDTLEKIKKLPEEEKQKVYDFYGFELYKNNRVEQGYSIVGYPANINNNEKLSKIKNSETINVIEDLKENVNKFITENKIKCTNKELENDINNIIKSLPELRTAIGCRQHGEIIEKSNGEKIQKGHQFDVFQHSLKVMQGIVKNPKFEELNASDKKIMMLAALLHDITKRERQKDSKHPDNSSFDAFFIAKKFNLNQDEEIKLYNLIKHHEWLGYVNRSQNEEELEERMQSTAYDLRHDNIFDLSVIFTHADLKAVNDTFHDIKNELRISKVDGITRSFGEAADFYEEKIKKYIEELKTTQPLLPITKFPSSSTIQKAIKFVNEDGSTNIKGVYQDKDGLVILKYNELENEDLEEIGFPKNSKIKGIRAKTSENEDVNTGNIKFFVHGLDYSNQLAKFDAFSLVDSEVLLSVSYAERAESKSRFFRPQGIILDCDTKYIHGGGYKDAGSGYGKFINKFKKDYIFGGKRENDRKFISDLIKNTLDLNDEEYVQFLKNNENKSLQEFEPKESAEKLVRAFSTIKSTIREGNREYNEMYISNPKVPMGVFAYSEDENEIISNPIEFLNRDVQGENELSPVKLRTEFLRNYALEHNLPFVVFGK